jgi:hypothetical protein
MSSLIHNKRLGD